MTINCKPQRYTFNPIRYRRLPYVCFHKWNDLDSKKSVLARAIYQSSKNVTLTSTWWTTDDPQSALRDDSANHVNKGVRWPSYLWFPGDLKGKQVGKVSNIGFWCFSCFESFFHNTVLILLAARGSVEINCCFFTTLYYSWI